MNIKLLGVIMLGMMLQIFTSCESCTKKTSKKITELGLSVIEGVSEAIEEHGEKTSRKAADAMGKVLEGVGKSVEEQLNKHAEDVARVAGKTLVQTVEGLDKGLTEEYYDEIPHLDKFCVGVSLDYYGKIKTKSVIIAYFIITESGTYNCEFNFVNNENSSLMTKKAEIIKINGESKYSSVSFAFNSNEDELLKKSQLTKITVTKK